MSHCRIIIFAAINEWKYSLKNSKMKHVLIIIITCFFTLTIKAQNEKQIIKKHIETLASPAFHGRGYVFDGGKIAAGYIAKNFKLYGLLPFNRDSTFCQFHSFSINTFPNNTKLKINNTELIPGKDYLVNAASSSFVSEGEINLKIIDLGNIKDTASWLAVKPRLLDSMCGFFIKNTDTLSKYLKFSIRSIAREFSKGLYIMSKHGKMIWTANTETVPATIITVEDTVLPKKITKAMVSVEPEFISRFNTQNVVGYVPGTDIPDSFIVFTAHYDHLGQMGENTVFPGAHDNASGTSLVLYLAKYFAEHPQRYSIAFMLFSGEEAGLLGSEYYVKNPLFPLNKIRFLINLDMTGDATNGVTMVNAQTNQSEYTLINSINEEQGYLPKINQREQTQNSDHWPFSKSGVKAVFIYGMGTKPYYHDIYDMAKEISLENIDGLSSLLIDFTKELQ